MNASEQRPMDSNPESEFVNVKEPRNRFQGIDSATNAAWRAGKSTRIVVPARQAGSRFLGPLKGLQIRAQLFSADS
jgi:hypothetical protein